MLIGITELIKKIRLARKGAGNQITSSLSLALRGLRGHILGAGGAGYQKARAYSSLEKSRASKGYPNPSSLRFLERANGPERHQGR